LTAQPSTGLAKETNAAAWKWFVNMNDISIRQLRTEKVRQRRKFVQQMTLSGISLLFWSAAEEGRIERNEVLPLVWYVRVLEYSPDWTFGFA